MDHFCERLALHNRMMGHVLLVDRAGRVRWRAHGAPAQGEAENLLRALRGLVAADRSGSGGWGGGAGAAGGGALR